MDREDALLIKPVALERQGQGAPEAVDGHAPLVAYLQARALWLPARLLSAGHAPLRFVLLHSLYLLAPLADLVGLTPQRGWVAWGEALTTTMSAADQPVTPTETAYDPT